MTSEKRRSVFFGNISNSLLQPRMTRSNLPAVSDSEGNQLFELRFLCVKTLHDTIITPNLDVDTHAYLFNKNGEFLDCIFYKNTELLGKSVKLYKNVIFVDLLNLPIRCSFIVFSISVYQGGSIKDLTKSILQISSYISKRSLLLTHIETSEILNSPDFNEIILGDIEIASGNPTMLNATSLIFLLLAEVEDVWYLKNTDVGVAAYTPKAIIQPAKQLVLDFIRCTEMGRDMLNSVKLTKLMYNAIFGKRNNFLNIENNNYILPYQEIGVDRKMNFMDISSSSGIYTYSSDVLTADPFKIRIETQQNMLDKDSMQQMIDLTWKNRIDTFFETNERWKVEIEKRIMFQEDKERYDDKLQKKLDEFDKKIKILSNYKDEFAQDVKHLTDTANKTFKNIETKLKNMQKFIEDNPFITQLSRTLGLFNERLQILEEKEKIDKNEIKDFFESIDQFCFILYTLCQLLFQSLSELRHETWSQDIRIRKIPEIWVQRMKNILKSCNQNSRNEIDNGNKEDKKEEDALSFHPEKKNQEKDILSLSSRYKSLLMFSPKPISSSFSKLSFSSISSLSSSSFFTDELTKKKGKKKKKKKKGKKRGVERYLENLHQLEFASNNFAKTVRKISSSTATDGIKGLNQIEKEILVFTGSQKTSELLHDLEKVISQIRVAGFEANFNKIC